MLSEILSRFFRGGELTRAISELTLPLPHEQTRWSNDGRSELLKGDSYRPMASSEWEWGDARDPIPANRPSSRVVEQDRGGFFDNSVDGIRQPNTTRRR
jgi:hypothetical protein